MQPGVVEDATDFTWIRNIYTEKPSITGAEGCGAAAPCSAVPAVICPFVR